MRTLSVVFFLLLNGVLYGQQPIYTLYYANPLPVNPALAGSAHQLRAGVNFRNQWTNFVSPITAYSVFADNYFGTIKSGIGFSVYTDLAGAVNYRSTNISLYYAYIAQLADNVHLKAGIQPALGMNGLDQGQLVYNDQLSVAGHTGSATAESFASSKTTYFNLHSGVVLTARQCWIGVTGHNLLTPKSGYTDASKLPIGFGVQAGMKIEFLANQITRKEKKERFLMPHVYFASTEVGKQLFLGTELVYEPFSIGGTLRGNFFSKPAGTTNVTSFALAIGFRKKNVHSNYSYEIPLSKTSVLGPSHEISIRTLFKVWQRPTRRKIERLDLF